MSEVLEPFVFHVYQDSHGFWTGVEEQPDGTLELFVAGTPGVVHVLEDCFTRSRRTAAGAVIHLEPQRRDPGPSEGWQPEPPRRAEH